MGEQPNLDRLQPQDGRPDISAEALPVDVNSLGISIIPRVAHPLSDGPFHVLEPPVFGPTFVLLEL